MDDSRLMGDGEFVGKMKKKLNGISHEWAVSHCLLASCCDCVSMVIISISDINPAFTALPRLLTNYHVSQKELKQTQ